MTAPTARVLLLTLSERTSAKGRRYMSGWLGKASVVAFEAEEPDRYGNPCWEVFVAEPQQREGYAGGARDRGRNNRHENSRRGVSEVNHDGIMIDHRPPARRQGAQHHHGHNDAIAPPDRAPGWRGPSTYRKPRAPAPAGSLEVLDDSLEDIGR